MGLGTGSAGGLSSLNSGSGMKIGGAPFLVCNMVFEYLHLSELGHQLLLLPEVGLRTGLRTGSAGGFGSLDSRSEMKIREAFSGVSFFPFLVLNMVSGYFPLLELGHQLLLLPEVGLHTGLSTGSAGGLSSLDSRNEMRFGRAPATLFSFSTWCLNVSTCRNWVMSCCCSCKWACTSGLITSLTAELRSLNAKGGPAQVD
jgi:hypothetical protein